MLASIGNLQFVGERNIKSVKLVLHGSQKVPCQECLLKQEDDWKLNIDSNVGLTVFRNGLNKPLKLAAA